MNVSVQLFPADNVVVRTTLPLSTKLTTTDAGFPNPYGSLFTHSFLTGISIFSGV